MIADHIRACSFLITDGVVPSNEGRGYVLRRIIRRAVRHGYKLGQRQPFFYSSCPRWWRPWARRSRSWRARPSRCSGCCAQEEERFAETLAAGMAAVRCAHARARAASTVPGALVFLLHDTYGFPPDLTADIARERGLHGGPGRLRARDGGAARARARGEQVRRGSARRRADRRSAASSAATRRSKARAACVALLRDGASVRGAGRRRARRGDARPHAVLCRVRRPGRRHRRAARRRRRTRFAVEDTQKRGAAHFAHRPARRSGAAAASAMRCWRASTPSGARRSA